MRHLCGLGMTTAVLRELRADLGDVFSADTSVDPAQWSGGSSGHCAVVSMLVDGLFHAWFVSAIVDGQSHWFNGVETDDGGWVYADLTADQFGLDPVIVSRTAPHHGARARHRQEISRETLVRCDRLRSRLPARWRDI